MCRLQKSTEHARQCPSPIHTRAWSMTIAHHCHVFTIHIPAGHVVMYLQQYGPSHEPRHQQHLALSERARRPMPRLSTDSESWHSCGHFAPIFKVIGKVWSCTARSTCKACTMGFCSPNLHRALVADGSTCTRGTVARMRHSST
jgi:hypothetical protein